jgi:ABC-type thiamine transport system ATPase subunit
MTRGGPLARHDERAGTVVHARGVPCRDRAARAERRAKLCQRLETGLARVLVAVDDRWLALFRGQRDRDDLGREAAARLRGKCTLLLCTHDLEEARTLATRVGVLNAGRLVAEGEPSEVLGGDDELALFRPPAERAT